MMSDDDERGEKEMDESESVGCDELREAGA
jgi:hypothetical protein